MPITHWISRNFPFSHEGFRGRLQISFHQIVININIKPTNITKNHQYPTAVITTSSKRIQPNSSKHVHFIRFPVTLRHASTPIQSPNSLKKFTPFSTPSFKNSVNSKDQQANWTEFALDNERMRAGRRLHYELQPRSPQIKSNSNSGIKFY